MARLQVEINGNATGLTNSLNQANTSLNKFGQESEKASKQAQNITKSFGNANGVAMEFNRIIQDAPFGMMGIGNNLQQLAANFQTYSASARAAAAETGKTVSTFTLLKGALGAIVSPINLLTLGVAAVTSAWTIYERSAQKANKETKEAEENVKILGNSYSVLNASLNDDKGLQKAISSVNSLKINVDLANKGIVSKDDVLKQYNKTLGDSAGKLKTFAEVEDFIVKKSDAYIQAMMLRAAANTALEEAAKAAVQAQKLAIEPPKAEVKKVADNSQATQFLNSQGVAIEQAGNFVRGKLQEDAKKTEKTFTDIATEFQKKIGDINKQFNFDLFGDGSTGIAGGIKEYKDYLNKVRDIAQNIKFSLNIANSEGLDKELEKNKQKYKKYLDDLSAIEKNVNSSKKISNKGQTLSEISNTRVLIAENQALEEQQIRLKYEQKTQDIISNILEKAGVDRIKSRQQDLDQNKNYYDQLARQHKENADILIAITEARKASENAINDKWDKKTYDDVKKLYDKIGKLEEKKITGKSNEEIKLNLTKNLKAIEDIYNQVIDILKSQGLETHSVSSKMLDSFGKVYNNTDQNKENADLEKRLGKVVESGFRRGISNILDNIDDLGSNFYEVFSNTFSLLAKNVSSIFNDVLATQLGNQLTKLFESQDLQIGKLSNNVSKAIVAGAGIAGGLVSSMTSKTSTVGQGIGGALSGAAAGMAFGPVGAVVGGVIGGIAGIFGASAAKKREKLQQEQLEQQKKTNALLEYQNAKGWESAIIGQMTNQGFINGFSRSATGQLVAKISGRDILFMIEREQKLR